MALSVMVNEPNDRGVSSLASLTLELDAWFDFYGVLYVPTSLKTTGGAASVPTSR